MEIKNALSLVKRHDGSYFYLIELGLFNGYYKYMLANWDSNKLSSPIIIYSHTKRSNLSLSEQEFFDNNLLNKNRLEKYLTTGNAYIGGIDKIQDVLIREYKEGVFIPIKYKVYNRNNNFLLIENISMGDLNCYSLNEFINRTSAMDFETATIYTEKNLLSLSEEETPFVLNTLLDKRRVDKKVENNNGYVGSVEKIEGVFKKTYNENKEIQLKKMVA